MSPKQKRHQKIALWTPMSVLIAGVLVTMFMISRNSRGGYFKLK